MQGRESRSVPVPDDLRSPAGQGPVQGKFLLGSRHPAGAGRDVSVLTWNPAQGAVVLRAGSRPWSSAPVPATSRVRPPPTTCTATLWAWGPR